MEVAVRIRLKFRRAPGVAGGDKQTGHLTPDWRRVDHDGGRQMGVARAVLWDMDGTLIDSEEFHWISWRDTMAKEGIAITHEQFLASFGQRNDSIIPRWLGAASTPERIERIADAKEELYRDLIRKNGISPLPGVASWVHRLHQQGWLQVIASAAPL